MLVVGTVLTALGVTASARAVDLDAERRLDQASVDALDAVTSRVDADAVGLVQLRNAVTLDFPPTRSRFTRLASMGFDDDAWGGASAVGFASVVATDRTDELVAEVRADDSVDARGYPDFEVFPPTDADDRFVITIIEPLASNETAFGFDLGTNPSRRFAAETARDRGDLTATSPISLRGGAEAETGFLMLAAVYDAGEVPRTAPARRRHFAGLVVLVFPVDQLLDGVFTDLEAEIYDVGLTIDPPVEMLDPAQLLFDSDPGTRATDGHEHARALDLNVGDRRWRLLLDPGPDFAGRSPWLPLGIGVAGLAITALLGLVVRDIGRGRDRAQLLAGRMTEDLVTAEARFRSMIDQAPDATLLVAPDGTIELASAQVERLFGWSREDLVGQPIEVLLPERSRARHLRHRDGFRRDPRPRQMGVELELVGLHRDGGEIPVEVSLSPLDAGEDTRVIAAVRDVTLQREARRSLETALAREQEATDQLRETDRLRTAFLGTVSHELRTPLVAITGFVSMLLDRRDDLPDEVVDDLLERTQRNAETLGTFIGDLLDFTRLERGLVRVEPVPLDVGATVAEIVEELAPVTAEHDVRLVARPGITALADRHALTRIVTNLVTNAARYSPAGTRVTVSVVDEGQTVAVRIDDEGPGIPESERRLVFERFYRGTGDDVVRHVGAGIGLSVVHDLSIRMGGLVRIETAQGGGTSVVVTLPGLASPEGGPPGAGRPSTEQGA